MADALADIVVVERGTRLATSAVGHLLASLGARVLRLETIDTVQKIEATPLGERMLRWAGKERILLGDDMAEKWRKCQGMADVVLLDPPDADAPDRAIVQALLADSAGEKIICVLSPSGLDGGDAWRDVPDPLIQALGGTMAATGDEGGPPEFARVPVAELYSAVAAAAAVLAALRVRQRDGVGQLIDLSLIEVVADQLRVHLSMLEADPTQDFRQGCGHPICSPWNAYRARDGWVLICSSSDAQWHAVLDVIGRPDLKQEPRYARVFNRRLLVNEVDALVQAWVGKHSMQDAVAAVSAAGVPAGEARNIPAVMRDDVLRQRGTIVDLAGKQAIFGSAIGLGRSPVKRGMTITPVTTGVPAARCAPAARVAVCGDPAAPLKGVRVVEISRYTAGPLAGMILASLGAEVIKVESPDGEETRRWMPQHGGASGYFINHNAGKRSVALDLRRTDHQQQLADLVAGSDVLLQNLRPGVMDQIGLGPVEATERHPRLIHTTISGFGLKGPALPALDTVVQGLGGLTSLIGDGKTPCRVGFSIADQMSGHLTALAILAALAERERSGQGQIIDTAMCDAIAWLTQLAWPDGHSAIGVCSRWRAKDGWVAAAATEAAVRDAIGMQDATSRSRNELVADLARLGISAAPVLEPAEAFAQPVLQTRRSVFDIASGDTTARLLTIPLDLTLTPVLRPQRMHALGEDNAALLPNIHKRPVAE
jgi:crotonobetainyl-CoA:carnitine CoA-transferase CaiB-like acyl-CoA transferase